MSLIIKMDPISKVDHLKKAVPYILNEAKTQGLYYSNSGDTADEILEAFRFTREVNASRGNRVGYHFKFSFSKDETIAPEKALNFIREWAAEYLGEEYDFVTAVHSDRDHTHMHLIFNSVRRNGGKYRYEKGDWDKIIRPLTNRLAKKYGTGLLRDKDKALDYDEGPQAREKWADIIKADIDACITDCLNEKDISYESFKKVLEEKYGYKLREGVSRNYGVYLSLTPPGKAKAVRTYQLGEDYMPAAIDARMRGLYLTDMGKYRTSNTRRNTFNPDKSDDYRNIYSAKTWFIDRPSSFVPYRELSVYQQYFVRKMLDARRLYRATGSSKLMKEQSTIAMKGLSEDAIFVCRLRIRSHAELQKMIDDLADEMKVQEKRSGPVVHKYERQKEIIKKLKQMENRVHIRRRDRR